METNPITRACWLEINLDHLKDNFMNFRRMVGSKVRIMPAIKANAYGHGLIPCALMLEECGADYLGVGSLDDGILLRENGIKTPILIFASCLVEEMASLYVQYQLIPTILSYQAAKAVSDTAKTAMPVFIAMDTGRGRLGINSEEFPEFFRKVAALPHIHVEGVYSHMAAVQWPDQGDEYAQWQFKRFQGAMKGIGEATEKIPFRQLANTPGAIALPEIRMTGVCPGRAMWGYSPLEKRKESPELKAPMVSWKSRLIHINEVWGGKFGSKCSAVRLDTPKRIGIMACGLSDGLSPELSHGYVLLHGRKCPIASSLSLEHTILDLTDFPDAKVGDEIVIMGRQGEKEISREQRMKEWNRPVPRIWTDINPRMARLYIKGGQKWGYLVNERIVRL